MKKMFTLIVALGTLGSVFAQTGHSDYNNNRSYTVANSYSNSYSFSKERELQIQRINKDFDKQIKSVQKNHFLKSFEKERQIRMLEAQRMQKIREVNDRFSDSYIGYNNNRSNHRW